MRSHTVATQKIQTSPAAPPLVQVLLITFYAGVFFVMFLAVAGMVFDRQHVGKIYPGVTVAGVDVSGLTQEEAAQLIQSRLTFADTGRIVFSDAGQVWEARPVELGLFFDPRVSAQAAFALGRSANPLANAWMRVMVWYGGRDLPPLLVYDERVALAFVSRIAAQVERPVEEASLVIDGAQVVANTGQIGRRVDVDATLAPLAGQLQSLTDGILPLVVEEIRPQVLDTEGAVDRARAILSAPLTLTIPDPQEGDPGPWVLEPERLARMLMVERTETFGGARLDVSLDVDALRTFISALGPAVAQATENARFVFNDETRVLELLEPARIGRSLEVEATLQGVQAALLAGEHNAPLILTVQQPVVGDAASGAELGVTELVSSHTSYFYGSSASRIQNIEIASAQFHGLLVPPGATFSMADTLGDVSLDNGYAEALIIYGDRTIEGVGGGVCQVSTTLFRTVFFAGFPVVERYPHAYRVYYYELNAANQVDSRLAGLDATVYVPLVDFKFVNDSPHWLLMETYVNAAARTLTWKFYSTSDGRTVEWETTGLQNEQEPGEPKYVENPELAQGDIEQVDWGVAGADVTVTRSVWKDGGVLFQDAFSTHYVPWSDLYEYGPGTRIPTGEDEGAWEKPQRE